MGISGISIWQLLIVLLIIVVLFGTRNCVASAPIWAAR